jgi:hypothetical protein
MHKRVPQTADSLRAFVLAVIADGGAPAAIRNQCHRLMLAIDARDQALIEESVASLEEVAKRTEYALPPSATNGIDKG